MIGRRDEVRMTQIATRQRPRGHSAASQLLDKHRETLERALRAIRERAYWSPYPEVPSGSIYGETANDEGRAAFEAQRGSSFHLDQPQTGEEVGGEHSPYGFDLAIRYPGIDVDAVLAAMSAALPHWR